MDLDEHLWMRLGFDTGTQAWLRGVAADVEASPDDMAALREAIEAIRGVLGVIPQRRGEDVLAATAGHPRGNGVLAILALLATLPDAIAVRRGLGQSEDLALEAFADISQQMRVHEAVHGSRGLTTHRWLLASWRGALLWPGRLQANVEPMWGDVDGVPEGEPACFLHIPETGPLAPAAVDASLIRIGELMPRHYPQAAANGYFCGSWLLDPAVSALVPDGNIARFAARFEPTGLSAPGDRDALFFGCRVELGEELDLDAVPARTRLQHGIVDHLRSGGHFHVVVGRLGETP